MKNRPFLDLNFKDGTPLSAISTGKLFNEIIQSGDIDRLDGLIFTFKKALDVFNQNPKQLVGVSLKKIPSNDEVVLIGERLNKLYTQLLFIRKQMVDKHDKV